MCEQGETLNSAELGSVCQKFQIWTCAPLPLSPNSIGLNILSGQAYTSANSASLQRGEGGGVKLKKHDMLPNPCA